MLALVPSRRSGVKLSTQRVRQQVVRRLLRDRVLEGVGGFGVAARVDHQISFDERVDMALQLLLRDVDRIRSPHRREFERPPEDTCDLQRQLLLDVQLVDAAADHDLNGIG